MKFVARVFLLMMVVILPSLRAQNGAVPAKPAPTKTDAPAPTPDATKPPVKPAQDAASKEYLSKTFQVKYVDPDQIRSLFSGRSFVIDVNRDLRALTVHGPAPVLKEVEDAIQQFDVAPSPPANVQITVDLLTSPEMAPAGAAVPTELSALAKEFGKKTAKLADSQIIRVREGQVGDASQVTFKPEAASLARVWLQSAVVSAGAKGDRVTLYGLRVWLNIPPPPGATGVAATTQARAEPDVVADVDVDLNQAVMVSKVGVDQPVMVVVRVTVIR